MCCIEPTKVNQCLRLFVLVAGFVLLFTCNRFPSEAGPCSAARGGSRFMLLCALTLSERSLCALDAMPSPLYNKMFNCDRCGLYLRAHLAWQRRTPCGWLCAVSDARFLIVLFLNDLFFPSDSVLLAIKLLGTRKHRLWWESCSVVAWLLLCAMCSVCTEETNDADCLCSA